MSSPYSSPESLDSIRSSRIHWLAYANAALWGLGAGFATATLAVYLIGSLGGIRLLTGSLLLAAPQFVGLARVLAIPFSSNRPFRKRFCLGSYLASGLTLAALPWVVWRLSHLRPWWESFPQLLELLSARDATIVVIIGLWCAYYLFESLATVSLWAWLGDLVPLEQRGAFIGWRQFWLEGCRALGLIASAALIGWNDPRKLEAADYAKLAAVGATLFVLAVIPLVFLPSRRTKLNPPELAGAPRKARFTDVFALLTDTRLSRLMLYGCWFSFFNGATQGAQNRFAWSVLEVAVAWMLAFRVSMITGQAIVSPWLGRLADQIGYRPVLLVCQAIVAISMFGYLFATEEIWWFIGFAWAGWIAYAGINLALPGLLLKLSPPEKTAGSLAGFFAISGLCYGLSTIVGGFIFDNVRGQEFQVMGWMLDRYQYSFYVALVTRILGCFFIYAIDEPTPNHAEPSAR